MEPGPHGVGKNSHLHNKKAEGGLCLIYPELKCLSNFKVATETWFFFVRDCPRENKLFQVCCIRVLIPQFSVISLATSTGACKNFIHLQKGWIMTDWAEYRSCQKLVVFMLHSNFEFSLFFFFFCKYKTQRVPGKQS